MKNVKIFAKTIEKEALDQIEMLANFEAYKDSRIRIMPDCHAGKGCTVGTTMTITDKLTPNLVGVDIGCGMLTIKLKETSIDLENLDKVINKLIPSGFNIHKTQQAEFDFTGLVANVNIDRAKLSIGTLGGGNHFIEVGKDGNNDLFLVIHSGSRNIGLEVAKYHQEIATKNLSNRSTEREELINKLKKEGKENKISEELKKIKSKFINKDLAYLTGIDFENYINDMRIIQNFSSLNRRTMANIILKNANLTEESSFETIHNYIDFKRMILRKGAVSAENGEMLLIPINMRDGSILAIGKGNEDWNYSAPHGAGRLMSRTVAHKSLKMEDFKAQMKEVYSTSVSEKTLDEAPEAYKPINEIMEAIQDTVYIIDIIKPIYNFKANN